MAALSVRWRSLDLETTGWRKEHAMPRGHHQALWTWPTPTADDDSAAAENGLHIYFHRYPVYRVSKSEDLVEQ